MRNEDVNTLAEMALRLDDSDPRGAAVVAATAARLAAEVPEDERGRFAQILLGGPTLPEGRAARLQKLADIGSFLPGPESGAP
jgi:hypothetical protein